MEQQNRNSVEKVKQKILHAAVKVFVHDFADYTRSTGKSYREWHVGNLKPKSQTVKLRE